MSKLSCKAYDQEFPALGTELDSIKRREITPLTQTQVANKIVEIINSTDIELRKKLLINKLLSI